MTYVQSSAIEQIIYDPEVQPLVATLRDYGRTYIYADVPVEVYDSLLFSDSLCAHFNARIRDRFSYREI